MFRTQFSAAPLLLLLACAGCADDSVSEPAPTSVTSPGSSTPTAQRPQDIAAAAALRVYEAYWQVSEQAEAAPREKDWRSELAKTMVDPALTPFVEEVRNLASVPAHFVGTYKRAPKVTSVSLDQPSRVVVIDCLDATDKHLVSDKRGEDGKNLDNPSQPRRYEFEAQAVQYPNPDRWLIQQTEARLEKPC